MKFYHVFILLALQYGVVIAQPQITEVNLPKMDDYVSIAICSDIPSPAELDEQTGENYTWDFSDLTESEEQFFEFVTPASTLWSDDYPNSNICGISWDDSYTYYNISPEALTTEGNKIIIAPGDTASIIYDDPEQIVPVPYSMGSTFSDNFSGSGSFGGFEVTISGTTEFEADGYGTLILPNATYQNVVRYRIERVQSNEITGFPPTEQTKTQWAWVSADYRFWLLLIEETDDGFSTSFQVWFDKEPIPATSTGIREANHDGSIRIFPNPVSRDGRIHIMDKATGITTLYLFDTNGKLLISRKIATPASVSLNGLKPGIYQLKLVDNMGRVVTTEKIVTL